MKNILNKMFGWGFFGIPNWAGFVFIGCITPFIGRLFDNYMFSQPVNPAAIVFWALGAISLAASIYLSIKDK